MNATSLELTREMEEAAAVAHQLRVAREKRARGMRL